MKRKIISTVLFTVILLVFALIFSKYKSNAPSPSLDTGGKQINSEILSSDPQIISSQVSSPPQEITGFNANKTGLPIVLFHHFLRDEYKKGNKNVITQSESEFEAQIKALSDNGFKSISLNDAEAFLKGGKEIPPKSILLTFDDGYKSNVVIAAPILRKYGYKAVLFTMTAAIDYPDTEYNPAANVFQYINRNDMKNAADVFTYACHCDSRHINYTATDRNIFVPDLLLCKEKLSNTDVMAYPLGKYNQAVIGIMKELGFNYCFTTERRFAKPGVDLYAIPRFTISAGTTTEQFMNIVETGVK